MAAIKNPYVDCIGHPTGRLLTRRPGADVAFERNPQGGRRLRRDDGNQRPPQPSDLDDVRAAAARDLGIPIVISTDSHSPNGFDLLQFGVFQARRAGLEKKDVANTRPVKEFRSLLRRSR